LTKLLKLIILALLAKMQHTILLSIDQICQLIFIELLTN